MANTGLRANRRELERFKKLVKGMKRGSLVYEMLKGELQEMGYWRNLPRGNPAKGKQLQGSKSGT